MDRVVTVPNVFSAWVDASKQGLTRAGLKPRVVWVHGGGLGSVDWGHVYRQIPAAGTVVPAGSTVRIYGGWEAS